MVRLPDVALGSEAEAARPLSTARPASLLIPTGSQEQPKSLVQKALQESDKRFQYGKFCIQEEKYDQARAEFDAALNVLLELPADLPDRALAERKFEELIRLIHRYDLDSLGASGAKDEPVYTQSPLGQILELTFPVDPRLKDKVGSQVLAGQSQLPLVVNDAVLSYISYFTNSKGSRTLLAGMRRSGRYRDMILRIFAEEGVPRELIHVAQAESGFAPMAVSYKSATGMWQFMRPRGKEYGLNSSNLHDDRLDPEKATRAAARHFRDLYQQTGDWLLAMAAYNCGPACVERAVQRTGHADYWELRARNAIPKDTRSYVPAILAMAIVSNNLEAYGLTAPQLEPALVYDTIDVDAKTNLGLIADAADVPAAEIREMNPSMIHGVAPENSQVHVPKGKGQEIFAVLESVPAENRKSWRLHRVADGDTLASISKRYSAPASAIIQTNAHLGEGFFSAPQAGEMVLIPAKEAPLKATSKRTSSRTSASRSKSKSKKSVAARSKAKRPATQKVASTSVKRRTVAR
jgi:membrane-bound lytic murein transglycosylase D